MGVERYYGAEVGHWWCLDTYISPGDVLQFASFGGDGAIHRELCTRSRPCRHKLQARNGHQCQAGRAKGTGG